MQYDHMTHDHMTCQRLVPVLLCLWLCGGSDARGGGRRKMGQGQKHLIGGSNSNLNIGRHPKGAQIVKASHFAQSYKLGYKILLICIAKGDPLPYIKWFKDGQELALKPNTHIYEKRIRSDVLKSKIEIDPATVGDQGIYTCMANNKHSVMVKNFKTEYFF